MAKQTFTTGQVLTAAQMTSLQQTAMGGGSTTAKTASYTLVAADAGTVVQMNSASATTITVNTALFAAGDTVQIQNVGAGVCTVTAGTATVSTSATLALKQYDAGTLYFNTTSAAIFFAVDAADVSIPANDYNYVSATESTTSTSYTNLTTAGPAVTVTTGTKALVIVSAKIFNGTNNNSLQAFMTYAVSGATTTAAADTWALAASGIQSTGYQFKMSLASVATLTAGSNVFTAKYRATSGTSEFGDRSIFVINLA